MSLERLGNSFYYTTRPGDTLWTISKKFNVSVDKLKYMNNLNSVSLSGVDNIIVFKNIVIHEVTSRDTLESISETYDVPIENILKNNELTAEDFKQGLKLVILC